MLKVLENDFLSHFSEYPAPLFVHRIILILWITTLAIIKETLDYRHCAPLFKKKNQNVYGSGGIRTHASEETGALNQRLRPLGHATFLLLK